MTNQTPPLTDQQLADITARATSEHLTPGPWTLDKEGCDCGGDYSCGHGLYVTGVVTPTPTWFAVERAKRTGEEPRDYDFRRSDISDFTMADWELMAHAPEDVRVLLAEVHRLRAELAEYEVLNPQQCPAGKHADWLVDSEYAHACPWCENEKLRAELAAAGTKALATEADEIVLHCPDHGPQDQDGVWMDCHCAVADDIRRRLALPAAVSRVVADGSSDPAHTDDHPGREPAPVVPAGVPAANKDSNQ